MKHTYIGAILFACLIFGLCMSPAAAANNFGSGITNLQKEQKHMYNVNVESESQIYMTVPSGANFDLYALQCQETGCNCPSFEYVMQFATETSLNGVGMQEILYLPSGSWCIVVFARSGTGIYSISEIIGQPPVIIPTPPAEENSAISGNQNLYREAVQHGTFDQGESTVYMYQIGGDRTAIEWYAQPTGCNTYELPIMMATGESIDSVREAYPSCDLELDLYVYKGCHPRYSPCTALYADTSSGSGAYVGIAYPEVGMKYYVQAYAKSGSGPFRLIARSYTVNEAPIVMMSLDNLYTEMNVAAPT